MTDRRTTATITDLNGDILSDGLQTCDVSDEALNIARRRAEESETAVILCDADGDWRVEPNGDATRI